MGKQNESKRHIELQNRIDKIQFFLSRTTEPFDDWDYDGDHLKIFLHNELTETYSNRDLSEIIG